MQEEQPYVINDDIRYQHEITYAIEGGWYLVFVYATEELRRQRAESTGVTFTEGHASEALFNNMLEVMGCCDLVIHNNSPSKADGKRYLKNQATLIIKKIGV